MGRLESEPFFFIFLRFSFCLLTSTFWYHFRFIEEDNAVLQCSRTAHTRTRVDGCVLVLSNGDAQWTDCFGAAVRIAVSDNRRGKTRVPDGGHSHLGPSPCQHHHQRSTSTGGYPEFSAERSTEASSLPWPLKD